MLISGWGRYPVHDSEVSVMRRYDDVRFFLASVDRKNRFIPRGAGRSYGDSALAAYVADMTLLNNVLGFDRISGKIICQSGVTIQTILETIVPAGWFLPVVPGTQAVSVGGAIASDIHGKNHHQHGCLSNHVLGLKIMLSDGRIVSCSRTENAELFRATCGGMGLTGLVLEAEIALIPVRSSFIDQTAIRTAGLDETVAVLEENVGSTYSVAWLDCLSRRRSFGRGVVFLGEHSREGGFVPSGVRRVTIPFDMPSSLLNRSAARLFNHFYYHRHGPRAARKRIHYERFFFPLDRIGKWNRLYGRQGFLQYQFVIPEESGLPSLRRIVRQIAESGRPTFLAVLKRLGEMNSNHLSFPLRGWTLALDFGIDRGVFAFLDQMDRMVIDAGGRVYLCKDSRMDETVFKAGYPAWQEFQEVRKTWSSTGVFASLQSDRLGLT